MLDTSIKLQEMYTYVLCYSCPLSPSNARQNCVMPRAFKLAQKSPLKTRSQNRPFSNVRIFKDILDRSIKTVGKVQLCVMLLMLIESQQCPVELSNAPSVQVGLKMGISRFSNRPFSNVLYFQRYSRQVYKTVGHVHLCVMLLMPVESQ